MPNGKTEMWYVIEAEDQSRLISGFSKKVTQQQYLHHLQNKSLPEILNFESVQKGDVFFMPAGRIHALGPGILLAEIQQTSDATYRIYDWDRVDANGASRELHTEEAMAAIDFNVYPDYRTRYRDLPGGTTELVSCPYFTTNKVELARPLEKDYSEMDSFVVYICLDGKAVINSEEGGKVELRKGEVLLIPASVERVELFPDPSVKILEVYIS
jgi:mannose-6-phosphate isomerase